MEKTVLYKRLYLFLLTLLSPFPGVLHAQEPGIGPIEIGDIRQMTQQELSALPDNVRQIREAQLRLAREDNAVIEIIDTPGRSRSIIHEVPDFLSTRVLTSDSDITETIVDFYPYYGFGGTESLRLETKIGETYRFRQYIDDIRTPHAVLVTVDNKTGYIKRVLGSTVLDLNYPRIPQLSEEEAIDAAMRLANKKDAENVAAGVGLFYLLDGGGIYTEIEEYVPWGEESILEPVWTVYIPLLEPWDPGFTHYAFQIKPNGEVIEPEITLDAARVCDGFQPAPNQSPYCTDPERPLVVYSDGMCATGINCTLNYDCPNADGAG